MTLNFLKSADQLIPAIIQDDNTNKVLMLGFMNEEALKTTQDLGKVTFYSRTKKRLWTKGETTGNFLIVKSIKADCDNDSLLIKAEPIGVVCHTGADTCWFEENTPTENADSDLEFLAHLAAIIQKRKLAPDDQSYTSALFKIGINKIAQKVGEEAVEIVINSLAIHLLDRLTWSQMKSVPL